MRVGLIASLAVCLAACGGGGDSSPPTGGQVPMSSPTPTPTPTPPPPEATPFQATMGAPLIAGVTFDITAISTSETWAISLPRPTVAESSV